MNDNTKNQIIERLKQANHVLVTVSANPSVDQLSACIGLTLLLNKINKHGTAVYSGETPSTIEFLKPEATIEKNTDSLRDFIIALDKAKADKLRYKVEDKVVKIFITPYRTSITQKDLVFSQGDFNVDAVVALGVHKQQDLDQAITAHGRILHDATVISINTSTNGELGSINWVNDKASSLCELVVEIGEALGGPNVFDSQMATAFLTGIVAETKRFSNAKATPNTMSITGRLMAAGASTQLVAKELEPPPPPPPPQPPKPSPDKSSGGEEKPTLDHDKDKVKGEEDSKTSNAGILQINHGHSNVELPELGDAYYEDFEEDEEKNKNLSKIRIDEEGNLTPEEEALKQVAEQAKREQESQDKQGQQAPKAAQISSFGSKTAPNLIQEPPAMGGTLTANSKPEELTPSTDPLSPQAKSRLLSHDSGPAPQQAKAETSQSTSEETLDHVEQTVASSHEPNIIKPDTEHVDSARDAVKQAMNSSVDSRPPEPIQALNAQPVNLDLGHDVKKTDNSHDSGRDYMTQPPSSFNMPSNLVPPAKPAEDYSASKNNAAQNNGMPPPPVPPPLMPPVL